MSNIPKINETWQSGERVTSTKLNKVNNTVDAMVDVVNEIEPKVQQNTQTLQQLSVTGGATTAAGVIFNDGENAEIKVNEVEKNVEGEYDEITGLIYDNADRDTIDIPTMGGQPMVLHGAGAPSESIVPDEWKQFDPDTEEGSNWTGIPTMLGQRYINTSTSSSTKCDEYIAVRDGVYGLKWLII